MNKCFKYVTNDQWQTPSNIYNHVINELGYIDFNPLCVDYDDSLKKEFDCKLFCNPPFSNIEPFVDYMINHCDKGYECIMLLPVRSGTSWFRKIALNPHCNIWFFTQRLHFSDKGSCPFDCMLVYFEPKIIFYKFRRASFGFMDRNLNKFRLE